jgi:GAF domain-containing protein
MRYAGLNVQRALGKILAADYARLRYNTASSIYSMCKAKGNSMWARLLRRETYKSELDFDRARLVGQVMLTLMIIFLVFGFGVSYSELGPARDTTWFAAAATLQYPVFTAQVVVFVTAFLFGSWALSRQQVRLAEYAPVVMVFIVGVILAFYTSGMSSPVDTIAAASFILIAGLLKGSWGLLFSTPIVCIIYFVGIYDYDVWDLETRFARIISGCLVFIGIAAVTYQFLRFVDLARNEGASKSAEERLKLATLTTDLSQRISRREPLHDVMMKLVSRICQDYPMIYHAQVFLVDEQSEEARLVASTGEVGRQLLNRNHALAVGSTSVIGQTISKREIVIEYANAPGSMHRKNELLPETQAEAAIPLRIGETVIGALDLQSKNPTTFTSTDELEIFKSLAGSIAIAIDNARLFEQAELSVQENQRLVTQARQALREAESANDRMTGRAWSEYLKNQAQDLSVLFEFEGEEPTAYRAPSWTPTLEQATLQNAPINTRTEQSRIVAIPLRVRGQIIGAMEFELDKDAGVAPEDMDLVKEVSERFGLAVENTRLLEESQDRAGRESLVNEISARLQSANTVEGALTEAARSMSSTLNAAKVSIRLGAPRRQA